MNKYFKIVNPDGHNGMVYKEGYNEDILPFDPSGYCQSGGLYFASRDIFAFLDYGPDVYEVEPIGEIYEYSEGIIIYKAHALNMKYLGKWSDTNVIKYLVENGADIHVDDDYALRCAAADGHLEVVQYLIENEADINTHNNPLALAAKYGYLEIVKYLVEEGGADIYADNQFALECAKYNGHTEVIEYLKSKMDIK